MADFKLRRIVSVEEYDKKDGTKGKSYGEVGMLKEITTDKGGHFFTVKLNQNPGIEYKVYDVEKKEQAQQNQGQQGQGQKSGDGMQY